MSQGRKKNGRIRIPWNKGCLKKGILISWFIMIPINSGWYFIPYITFNNKTGPIWFSPWHTKDQPKKKKRVTCQITPHLLRVQMHLHSTHVSWNGLPEAEKPRELWTGHSLMWEVKEIIPFLSYTVVKMWQLALHIQTPFWRVRYLDPQNVPKTPYLRKIFGCLG